MQAICAYFGKDLTEKVPIFWSLLKDTIKITEDDILAFYATDDSSKLVNFDQANELILCLQLIECAAAAVHPSLIDELLELLPKLNLLLKHPLKAVSFISIAQTNPISFILLYFVFNSDSSYDCTLFGYISFNKFVSRYGFDCKRLFNSIANN